MINDILTDLVRTTKGIDFDVIKCVPNASNKPEFYAMVDSGTIMMKAKCKKEIPEFGKVFGLGNLNILRGYLDIFNTYGESVPVTVTINTTNRNGVDVPCDITFKAKGQSTATYRLMGENVLKKMRTLNDSAWDATALSIPKTKVQEFAKFASIMSAVVKNFSATANNGALSFTLGEHASSVSDVVVEMGEIEGSLASQYKYPIAQFLTILSHNNPVVKFSNKGHGMIAIDTGLFEYEFVFMGSN